MLDPAGTSLGVPMKAGAGNLNLRGTRSSAEPVAAETREIHVAKVNALDKEIVFILIAIKSRNFIHHQKMTRLLFMTEP